MTAPHVDFLDFEQPAQSLSVYPSMHVCFDCQSYRMTSRGLYNKYLTAFLRIAQSHCLGDDIARAASLIA